MDMCEYLFCFPIKHSPSCQVARLWSPDGLLRYRVGERSAGIVLNNSHTIERISVFWQMARLPAQTRLLGDCAGGRGAAAGTGRTGR